MAAFRRLHLAWQPQLLLHLLNPRVLRPSLVPRQPSHYLFSSFGSVPDHAVFGRHKLTEEPGAPLLHDPEHRSLLLRLPVPVALLSPLYAQPEAVSAVD